MIRNVLLMLSTDQPPPPTEEVRWHAERCRDGETTYLATTRDLMGLNSDLSEVAFFGNADLGNRFLGKGTFVDYIRLDCKRGLDLLRTLPLYAERGAPSGTVALIELRDVVEAPDGEGLESLGGTIGETGLPLTLANLPDGHNRLHVYYRKASP